MTKPFIAVIGAGNMSCALVEGLIRNDFPANRIAVSSPHLDRSHSWVTNYPELHITRDNLEAANLADVIVLAVKPQQIKTVCEEIQPLLKQRRRLMISIASGIRLNTLAAWLQPEMPIVRAMPNLAASVGASATGLVKNTFVNTEEHDLAESLLRSIGLVSWCQEESQLDAVTAIAGSGPAYFFYVMEIMEASAIEMGLSPQQARVLVAQTAEGAARVAMTASETPDELRAKVTSKGGTTAAALEILTTSKFRDTFQSALNSAKARAEAIGNEWETL